MKTPYESLDSTKPEIRKNTPLIVFRSQAHKINIAIASTNTPMEVFRLFRNIKLSFSSHKDREIAAANFTPPKVKTWKDFIKTNPKSYTTKAYNHSHFLKQRTLSKRSANKRISSFKFRRNNGAHTTKSPSQTGTRRPFPLIYPKHKFSTMTHPNSHQPRNIIACVSWYINNHIVGILIILLVKHKISLSVLIPLSYNLILNEAKPAITTTYSRNHNNEKNDWTPDRLLAPTTNVRSYTQSTKTPITRQKNDPPIF